MSRLREWLDVAGFPDRALDLIRDATGRDDPLAAVRPPRPARLPVGLRVGFWSLCAGAGTSTTAALVAHRSAGAGSAPLLVDLDRWAPSLALRAQLQAASVADALLRPGQERACVSRWAQVPFLPGTPQLHTVFDAERLVALTESASSGSALVVDLGSGADALDRTLLASLGRLCVVAGTRVSQLQAAFCAVDLLREAPCQVALVVVQASDEDAERVASRLPWPLASAIPFDAYLAEDSFAARAPTLVAVDRLIRALC